MDSKRLRRRDFLFSPLGDMTPLAQENAQTGAAQVPRKPLGKTGVDIPILLMGGTWTFDPNYDKVLHRAFQLGVNYIDTAQEYANGQSQKTIAPFIRQIGDRKKLWITSKVKYEGERATPERFKAELDNCLRDLETDYLDMFFMHMITDESLLSPQTVKIAEELKQAGKIRFFGFSCHDTNVAELLSAAAKLGGGIDAIMFRYNFRKYGDVKLNRAMDECQEAGIGLIAMKTQASVPPELESVVKFQSRNFTLGQAKLKAVWADDRITAAVSGMKSVDLVTENTAAAMSPVQLSMDEFQQLDRLAALTAQHHCLGCSRYCEAQAGGRLRIADTLRYLMYAECYGEGEDARAMYNALPREARDFDQDGLRAASAACPQGIDIAARLAEARRLLEA